MLLAVYSAPAALHSGRLHVVLGGSVLPHPAKADKGGEDAFLFDDKRCLFGVADGVGGSAKNGVDPGAFSREMLERCHQAAACGVADALPDALRLASECPLSGGGGSSTLVLGQLEEGTSTLRLLNLGDSGAMVLRPAMREVSGTDAKQLWPRVGARPRPFPPLTPRPSPAASRSKSPTSRTLPGVQFSARRSRPTAGTGRTRPAPAPLTPSARRLTR